MALAKTNTKIYESEASKQLNMQIVTAGNTTAPNSIAYGNGIYAFAGYGESSVQYSSDGEFFETAFLTFDAYDVIYSESKEAFIIVGSKTVGSDKCPIIVSTVNFNSFTEVYNPGFITNNISFLYGIFEIGSRFFALAKCEADGCFFSSITFNSSFQVEANRTISIASDLHLVRICKGNNRFLIEAYGSGGYPNIYFCAATISGGSYISQRASSSDASDKPILLGFANGYFFRQESYNKKALTYSIDGLSWNSISTLNDTLDAVVYLNREYLFICEGKICRRNDIAITSEDVFNIVPGLPKTGPGVVVNDAAYLLGTNIIRLAAEDSDPTIEADKLSATQALKLSKNYSNQLYAALDARVSALEGN